MIKNSDLWPLYVLVLCLLQGACASVRDDTASTWPQELPQISYFVSAYEEDAQLHEHQSLQEYLKWVRGFYQGTKLYPRGWNDISADVLAETYSPDRLSSRERQLSLLGRDIATEWAKANSVRRVDNQSLTVWGVAATRAVDEGNVEETLEKITQDLQKLLSLELAPDRITAGRYHPQDPDDWFAI